MRSDNKMGEDLKAVAEDVMQLGARCVQAGRAWLNERRNEMTDRNDDYRPENNSNRSSYQSRPGAPQPRAQGSRGRQQQGYQQGYQQPQGSYQQGGYQPGAYQQGWQQGRSQYQPHYQQQGSQAQAGRYGSQEYASQDYGRAQAWGQEGMEREYGQSFEQGLGQTSLGQGPYERDDFGYGARAQSGWQQSRGSQSQQYGMPRQDSHQEYQGSSRGAYAQQGYSGYQSRGPGEGYGSSSGYGNPDQDRYGSHNYSGESFISPADTQQVHSGRGRQSYARPDYGSGYGTAGYGMGYSGVGPRNYTRSDERITEDLCERLTHDHDIDASDIEVKVANGTATLEGTVSQRWMKHRAEDLADNCSGVRSVDNRIRVQSQSETSGYASASRESGSSARASGGSQTGSPTTPTSGSTGTAH
ncbi:BON domain-containing protein [Novilysobacter arseniciresistens]|uniref:BON domain-containing protein n=1 Tax=Novilysobacter arseniciresistens TaxID=1385522 RepID=UPI0006914A5A|nr:BON domain-containing protein [Lysobacter arseniciresistens]